MIPEIEYYKLASKDLKRLREMKYEMEKKMMTERFNKFIEENYDTQNTKNEQLTEQLKKGELPSGWYYLKVNEELANCPVISECVVDYNLGLPLSYFYDFDVAKIEQVLAPVPSYDEWKAKLEENTQLKETVEALESELKEVCDVLIRKCPEMEEWVMLNWKNLYEETEK